MVLQRGPAEYDLFLRPDLHTHGHTQWFYFAVRDTHPPGERSLEADPGSRTTTMTTGTRVFDEQV